MPSPDDHQIVRQDLQQQCATLAPIAVGVDGGAESPLDHAENSFDLSTLTVLLSVEPPCHPSAIVATRQFISRSAMFGWYDRPCAVHEPRCLVHPLRIIARVGQEHFDPHSLRGVVHRTVPMAEVRRRSAVRHGRHDEMAAAVGQRRQLGKATISRGMPFPAGFSASCAAADKVVTDPVRLEAAGVNRRQLASRRKQTQRSCGPQRFIQQAIDPRSFQQPFASLV